MGMHMEGEEIDGLLHRNDGTQNLITFLLKKKTKPLLIALSHDSIIQAVLKTQNPELEACDSAPTWPKYLEGAHICKIPSTQNSFACWSVVPLVFLSFFIHRRA